MAKKIDGYIKLQINAGQANPSPPVGPALGQKGVNIMEFCKAFNASTQALQPGMPVPVVITVFSDRSFTFITKSPPASYLIQKAANINKGTGETGKVIIGRVKKSKLREIAKIKAEDLNAASEDAAISMLAGTARSMGVEVIDDEN